MRERTGEGKGSVTSANRIYRHVKRICLIGVHLQMKQRACVGGDSEASQDISAERCLQMTSRRDEAVSSAAAVTEHYLHHHHHH